ncbi:MAG TPA: endonuclease/exonuclease/phosphatase family protein [Casimicrobiaceae bacterium]|nr:endonuclease/exonuclease/phosphatase family protein [Casimicrobiaceae bacterium]
MSAENAGTVYVALATWNIHGGVGTDRRYDEDRVFEVLHEMQADVVALQEVASLEAHGTFLPRLTAATGYIVVAGPTHSRTGGDFGNAVLSRFAVRSMERIDLGIAGCEPRGALDVCLDVGGNLLRVIGTHLGLRPGERREQVRRLLAALDRGTPHATVLMGDVNEWYLWGRPLRWLHDHFRATPALATFPSRRPLIALDRIWVHPAAYLTRLDRHTSALARKASDHLPLVARIALAMTGDPPSHELADALGEAFIRAD